MDRTIDYSRGAGTIIPNEFIRLSTSRNYVHQGQDQWMSEVNLKDVPEVFDAALATRLSGNRYGTILVDRPGALVNLTVAPGGLRVEVAGESLEAARNASRYIKDLFPAKPKDPKPDVTYMNFWSASSMGPVSRRRSIEVPSWKDIHSNYTGKVQQDLDDAMRQANGESFTDGSLILWQGPPGAGKTYAIRALARSWRKWCDFHYIMDPERFFGADADYMMQVLMDNDNFYYDDDDEVQPSDFDIDDPDDSFLSSPAIPHRRAVDRKQRWKLLILEDSGELVRQTAKTEVHQAFSRLLNTVDGLIGQGLQVLVLITTNEDLNNLHEAVQRHGRCAYQTKFEALTKTEANEWLVEQGHSDITVSGRKSLAELYALTHGKEARELSTGTLGFGG